MVTVIPLNMYQGMTWFEQMLVDVNLFEELLHGLRWWLH